MYTHKTTLTLTDNTQQSVTFSAAELTNGRVSFQCSGGDARLAFGQTSATASQVGGVRVLADSAPLDVDLLLGYDTVAVIRDTNSNTVTVTVEVMTAPRLV